MSFLELAIIAITLLACLYSSYTDIRRKKISNRITYSLVAFGLLSLKALRQVGPDHPLAKTSP